MKIGFLGLRQAFDYYQIGGTESFIRRIAIQMVKEGNNVDYILYQNNEYSEISPIPGLTLRYFKSFEEALNSMKDGNFKHIITVYLLPKDRPEFGLYRKRNSNSITFHFIYFSWPELTVKRLLYFSDARLFPYNGKLFCISNRQYKYVKKWANNTVYILPPVPGGYFLEPEEKPNNKKIKITFLGRIDPGKGIEEVIEIFKAIRDSDKFEYCIYGIHIPEDKQSLKIHNWLKKQEHIEYIEVDRQRYSIEVERMTKNVLKETDIIILPYKRLSSTIDTPVTLLESMASLCVVLTKPFGNIPDIYGHSKFLTPVEGSVTEYALRLLKDIKYENIINERERLFEQNKKLDFKTENVARSFLACLRECE